MGDEFKASGQFNDVVGTAAFDGHEHPPLFELAKLTNMPKDKYWPVGFELSKLSPTQNDKIPFNIVAVNREEVKVQDIRDFDQIAKWANDKGELPVYRFIGFIKPDYFQVIFNRIDIKVIHKDLRDLHIVAYDPKSEAL